MPSAAISPPRSIVLWRRVVLVAALALAGGCGADRFTPRLSPPADWSRPEAAVRGVSSMADYQRFSQQFKTNRDLPPSRLCQVIIIVMLPRYGPVEQIRRGNMGHAAIDVGGRLYDMGSLNGYAYVFRPTAAVRFWHFPTADAALSTITGTSDCDDHLDRILRFDVTVTDAQAGRLHDWWQQMERQAISAPNNRLYVWSDWQCASSVSRSLRDAGVTFRAPSSPDGLGNYLTRNLRHTAGPRAGERTGATVLQKGRRPATEPGFVSQVGTLLFRWPGLFAAGRRSPLTLETPDGQLSPILWSDSPEYRRHVATFRVKPEEGVRLALSPGSAWGAQSTPNFAVGRWYHVATDHVIGQAAVGGMYVNGDTGKIVRREDPRVVRFDAFGGDRLVAPASRR